MFRGVAPRIQMAADEVAATATAEGHFELEVFREHGVVAHRSMGTGST